MAHDAPRRIGWGGVAVLVLVVAAGVWFFAFRGDAGSDVMARLEAGGPIRIGYAVEEPYAFLDTGTGRVTGEAPEVAREVLKRMGVTDIEPVVARFGELIPALQAGRLDVVTAGMFITPERCREVLFSAPTFRVEEGFIVKGGNPRDLHGYGDVAASEEVRLGVMGGSVQHGYARELGVPEERIVVFENYPTALVGLATDRVDAVAATSPTVAVQLRKAADRGFERAEPFEQPVIDGKSMVGYGGFGFRTEDRAFRDALNEKLGDFIGSPEHLELVRPFGFGEHTLPGDVTTESLCAGDR